MDKKEGFWDLYYRIENKINQFVDTIIEKVKDFFGNLYHNMEETLVTIFAANGAAAAISETAKDKNVPWFFENKFFIMTAAIALILFIVDLIRDKYLPRGLQLEEYEDEDYEEDAELETA